MTNCIMRDAARIGMFKANVDAGQAQSLRQVMPARTFLSI
jgi:hypothetical protein